MHRCVTAGLLLLGVLLWAFLIAHIVHSLDPHAQRSYTTRGRTFDREGSSHSPDLSSALSSLSPGPVSAVASSHFSVPPDSLHSFHLLSPASSTAPSAAPPSMSPSSAATSLIATSPLVLREDELPAVAMYSAPAVLLPSSIQDQHSIAPLLLSAALSTAYTSPWWRHRLSPSPPLTPCPVLSVLDATVQLNPSHVTAEHSTLSTSHHLHYTLTVTFPTLQLDWVVVHLSLHPTTESAGAVTDGSYRMTPAHPHRRAGEGMREAQWMWEHRLGGRLHGAGTAELAFTFHLNHSACDTDVTSTLISALFTPTRLVLATAAASPYLRDDETPHASHSATTNSPLLGVPIAARDNAHHDDVEAAVQGVLAQATLDPHIHHSERAGSAMGGAAQRVVMQMSTDGRVHAVPNAVPFNAFASQHQHMYADYAHAHAAGVDAHQLYGAEQAGVWFGEHGQPVAAGVEGVGGQQCAADDWWCQVDVMCQRCFNYEQPALCSPCAAVLRCQDRHCAHHAVSSFHSAHLTRPSRHDQRGGS